MNEIIVYPLVGITSLITIPIYSRLAFREWVYRRPQGTPQWRKVLGLFSIFTTFLCWGSTVVLLLWTRIEVRFRINSIAWFEILTEIAVIGAFAAIAMKGAARVLAFAAGMLLAACLLMRVI